MLNPALTSCGRFTASLQVSLCLHLQRRIQWQSKRLLRCRMTNFAKFVLRLQPQLQPRKQSLENNENPKTNLNCWRRLIMLNQVLLFIVFLAGILCLLIAGPKFLFHRDKPAAYFFMAMGLFFWGTATFLAFV